MGVKNLRKIFVIVFLSLFFTVKSFATHVFGIDLYYQYVSGNTYKVILVVYGDCAGNAFPNLTNGTAQVQVFNDPTATAVTTLTLAEEPPYPGIEVTPVCPSQINNTTCTNVAFPIPGIKKFVYSLNYTVPYASANWRFHFTGNMGATSAGRSTTITNIVNPGNTVIALDAKLNNATALNNSSVFGTIPTPFYCLNIPANYAPGSVDPDNDSLYFVQIPGYDANVNGLVTYIAPYTATAPLAAAPFTFTPSTGQMSFTPNQVQRSLAVMEVREYRNNVLVGTSQREMTVVVLNTCNNYPPTGDITNPTAGTLLSPTSLRVCQDVGAFSFHIDPTDPNNDTIDVTPSGLPAGATYTVTNNHTPHPTGVFTWNTTGVAPGTYTFYLTYEDNQCPLSAYQQIAYTIIVAPLPGNIFALVSPATCVKKAVFTVNPGTGVTNWTETVLQGATPIHTNTGLNGTLTDSLVAGTYTIRVTNDVGCNKDTVITLAPPIQPTITSVVITTPLCNGGVGTLTINGTGGTPAYTYANGANPYGASNTFTSLPAGGYTLHLKDQNLCIKDTNVTITEPTPIVPNPLITKVKCYGGTDGTITLNASGGTPGYTYAFGAGAYGAGNSWTGLAAGSYTLHIKDANNCIKDTILNVIQPTQINPNATVTNVTCSGGNDGAINIAANGGTPAYLYAEGANAYSGVNSWTGLTAGTYTIHIKDNNNCVKDTVLNIMQPTPVTVSAAPTNILCNGAATGVITINGAGGTPTYTYANGAGPYGATNTFSGLTAGTYTIHTQDANSCLKDTIITLTQPTPIVPGASVTNPLCYGAATGTITINGSGGVPGYTYANGAGPYGAGNTFTSLAAGSYVIHTKDANACIKDTTLNITQPTQIVPTPVVTKPQCFGGTDGSITINATGGTPGYTYANGAGAYGASSTFNGLAAGTYTIHTKDANNCVEDAIVVVSQPTVVTSTPTVTNVLCNGAATGSITINGAGGTSPYTYANGGGAYGASGTFSGLTAGTYTIHTMDSHSCLKDTVVTITQPTVLQITQVGVLPPSCYGSLNGAFTISATGGTPGYTYAANGNPYGNNNTISGLGAGTYTLHVKDANGCVKDTIINLTQPQPLVLNASVKNSTCPGLNDGKVVLNSTGGTAAYTYASGAGPFTANNVYAPLAPGTYIFHTKDLHGCTKDTTIAIVDSLFPTVSVNITNEHCYGLSEGIIKATGGGAASPYTYALDNNPYTIASIFPALPQGTYTVRVKDANGCLKDTVVTVTQPDRLVANVTMVQPKCFDSANGSMIIVASGGVQPYIYSLDLGMMSAVNTFTGLAAAAYTAHIRDNNNCNLDTIVVLDQPTKVSIDNIQVTDAKCHGDNTGTITVTASGGTPGYQYASDANAFQSANTLGDLYAGMHQIHVIDDHGCPADSIAKVKEPAPLAFTAAGVTYPTCESFSDGQVIVDGKGGTPAYTYSKDGSNFASNTTFGGLTEGTYTFYMMDANGCKHDTSLTLTGYPHILIADPTLTMPTCYGMNDGVIMINASGGLPPLYFQMDGNPTPGGTNDVFANLPAGYHMIVVTDSVNCTKSMQVLLKQPDSISLKLTATPNQCEGRDDKGLVNVEPAGGTAPYAYVWSTDTATRVTENSIRGLGNGTYSVVVYDANECNNKGEAVVGYDNCCIPYIPNAFTPNRDGKNDVFRAIFKGDMQLIRMSVYNRFGEMVWTTTTLMDGWDGVYKGRDQEMDTYFFYIEMICGLEGKKQFIKGDVTLVR